MSTGETILTICAIALFMLLSVNINRNYLVATNQSVDQQTQKDAVNYGQTIAEEIYSAPYDTLETIYNGYDDETDENRSKRYITRIKDTLSATIGISPEKMLIHGVKGKIVTVTVFHRKDGRWMQRSGYKVAVTPISE